MGACMGTTSSSVPGGIIFGAGFGFFGAVHGSELGERFIDYLYEE